jgi:NAD(P)-dependent dehydrogenase (short-subunit alcohol dehydrogenase family)
MCSQGRQGRGAGGGLIEAIPDQCRRQYPPLQPLPLVMKGKVKKVITLSSGHADLDFINDFEVEVSALYAASKAAMNVIVAKFNAQYKKDGVLFVSISPGAVEVGHFANGKSPCL